ncbi:MAG: hypothetical protein AAF485_26165, partial [Chloroflexota bacterium]
GIENLFEQGPYLLQGLEMNDQMLAFEVDLKPGRTAPSLVPTTNPQPLSETQTTQTTTILAVFNQFNQAVVLTVAEQSWIIAPKDNQLIEIPFGTYSYHVESEDGRLQAEGTKTWSLIPFYKISIQACKQTVVLLDDSQNCKD